jgi:hypothetical protein
MSDGAHEGILPTRAMHTIIGGEPAPAPEEGLSAEQMRDWIKAAPAAPENYDDCARRAAHLILLHWKEHPEDAQTDPYELYERIKFRNADIRQQIAALGLTGFQWGYAVNAARRVNELPPQRNPALIEIDVDGEAE